MIRQACGYVCTQHHVGWAPGSISGLCWSGIVLCPVISWPCYNGWTVCHGWKVGNEQSRVPSVAKHCSFTGYPAQFTKLKNNHSTCDFVAFRTFMEVYNQHLYLILNVPVALWEDLKSIRSLAFILHFPTASWNHSDLHRPLWICLFWIFWINGIIYGVWPLGSAMMASANRKSRKATPIW